MASFAFQIYLFFFFFLSKSTLSRQEGVTLETGELLTKLLNLDDEDSSSHPGELGQLGKQWKGGQVRQGEAR